MAATAAGLGTLGQSSPLVSTMGGNGGVGVERQERMYPRLRGRSRSRIMYHLCKWCCDLAQWCAHRDRVDHALRGALLCAGCHHAGALAVCTHADAICTQQHCVRRVQHTHRRRPPYFQVLVAVAANDVRAPSWVVSIVPWRRGGPGTGKDKGVWDVGVPVPESCWLGYMTICILLFF